MKPAILALAILALGACATTPGTTSQSDPFEGFNRSMYAFNDGLDRAVFEPAAKGYTAVTPKWSRERVSDFFQNLSEPVTFVNDVLQGEGDRAVETGLRFTLNSTFGLAGLFDIAEKQGVAAHDEDFGQTLARWGVDSGPFLVLPFIGASNPRDALAIGADRAVSPLSYVRYSGDDDEHYAAQFGVGLVRGINARSQVSDRITALREAEDPYQQYRDGHIRRRTAQIANETPTAPPATP